MLFKKRISSPSRPGRTRSRLLPAAILSTILSSLLLTGCGKKKQDVLYHALAFAPYVTLDPSVEQSTGTCILENVYETLTFYDDIAEVVRPCLAESWTSNAIMSEWTFRLRKDVVFHDGKSLTASAVKQSIERTMRLGAGASYIWDCVASIEALDESTVFFSLKYAAPLPIIASSGSAAYIFSPSAMDKDEDWFNEGNDAGSGPYRLVAVSKSSVTLEAFESYRGGWGTNKFKKVFVEEVPNEDRRTALLAEGEADLAYFPDVERMESLANCELNVDSSWRSVIMMFNTKKQPCADENFRKALAYAFPYDEMVNKVLKGRATLSKGMLPPGLWAHDDSLPSYTTDMEKARELLSRTGHTGEPFTLSYQPDRNDLNEVLALYRRNLEQLGLSPTLLPLDWESLQNMAIDPRPEARQDVLIMDWWPDYADPAGTFRPLLSDQGLNTGFNYSYLHDVAIEHELQRAVMLTLQNQKDTAKIYSSIQRRVLDRCYLNFLFDAATPVGSRKGLKGIRINPAYEACMYYYEITR